MQVGQAVFLLTSREQLMPGRYAGTEYRNGFELARIEAPAGKVYTCNPSNVFDLETGRIMLMHRRAEEMARQGYQIAVRLNNTFRVFQAQKHGDTGGWIVTRRDDCLTCNCPAHAKCQTCKHVMAVCSLLHRRAVRLREAGKVRVASRYENMAVRFALAA